MPDQLALPDPELVNLACKLASKEPDQIMAVAWRDDALVVVVQPGPKYIFSAQQIADAVPPTPRDRDRDQRTDAPRPKPKKT